jgi:hypothetical protein
MNVKLIRIWKESGDGIPEGTIPPHKTPWPETASELYRLSDHRLSAKLVLTFLRIEGVAWSARWIPTAVYPVT